MLAGAEQIGTGAEHMAVDQRHGRVGHAKEALQKLLDPHEAQQQVGVGLGVQVAQIDAAREARPRTLPAVTASYGSCLDHLEIRRQA